MRVLCLVCAALVAAATAWYIRRPHDREYVMRPDPEDGIQPFDPRTAATGLHAG